MNKLTKLLADLISIPSVNPVASGSEDPNTTCEERCAKYIAEFARRCGADVELQYVEPKRPTVICRLLARKAKRSIAFAPHTDTVSISNMTIDPFNPVIRNGRIYGRGSCDTKGSCAAMLWAFQRAAKCDLANKIQTNISFLGLMAEESGSDGAKYYCKHEKPINFVIVGEPTFPHVIFTHKGALWLKIVTRGKAAHGSNPDLGENAIEHMTNVIDYFRHEYVPYLRQFKHPVLGAATINLGQIRGGSQVNIVPDSCEMFVDYRTLPKLQSHPRIQAQVTRDLREKKKIPVSIASFRDCPALETSPKLPLVQKFHRIVSSVNSSSKLRGVSYCTDAAIFSRSGSPTIVFGPGDIAQAHTQDEFLELATLDPTAEIYYRFLEQL